MALRATVCMCCEYRAYTISCIYHKIVVSDVILRWVLVRWAIMWDAGLHLQHPQSLSLTEAVIHLQIYYKAL